MIQQDITVFVVIVILIPGAIFQQDMTPHAKFRRRRCGLARMVRLGRALGHHHIGAHRFGFGHQEFQLTGLVPTARQPGAIIALYPNLGPAKLFRETVQAFQWGR